MIQMIDNALMPLRQSMELLDLLLVMSKSLAPFVYVEKEMKSAFGVSEMMRL
jgi:hypothetical protein